MGALFMFWLGAVERRKRRIRSKGIKQGARFINITNIHKGWFDPCFAAVFQALYSMNPSPLNQIITNVVSTCDCSELLRMCNES